jgi:ADP-L-glycero-D-manno-heptose 6-epimerase
MIIVTGGAGFIGSVLVRDLNLLGHEDILIVDSLGVCDKWKNLVGKKFIDIVSVEEFRSILERRVEIGNIKTVFHLGATTSTLDTNADQMIENNFRFSRTLAEWSYRNNARLVYASSASVYGDGLKGFSDDPELYGKFKPLNVYAYSKLMFDQWLLKAPCAANAVGLRFFNVYGPNEYHKGEMMSVICKSYKQIRDEGYVRLFRSYHPKFRDGEQRRDFISVHDCSKVMLWLMEQNAITGVYNLGTGVSRTWNELAGSVFSALGKKPRIEYVEMPTALQERYQYVTEADMSRFHKLGYPHPFRTLEAGVHDYVQNYLMEDLGTY